MIGPRIFNPKVESGQFRALLSQTSFKKNDPALQGSTRFGVPQVGTSAKLWVKSDFIPLLPAGPTDTNHKTTSHG